MIPDLHQRLTLSVGVLIKMLLQMRQVPQVSIIQEALLIPVTMVQANIIFGVDKIWQ